MFNQNAGVLTVVGKMELSAEFSTGGDTFNFNDGTVNGTDRPPWAEGDARFASTKRIARASC